MKRMTGLSVLFAMAWLSGAARAQGERILHFDSRIEVASNASLRVAETIRVRADGGQIKHGIYRDFPQLYRGRWGLRRQTGFQVLRVFRDGQAEPYHLENRENGTRVYIGDGSRMVAAGEHTYELDYLTDRQLGFFPDHDELYWNATGNGWVFPIDRATATVVLPGGARPCSTEAYTGAQGEQGRDFTAAITEQNTAEFATTRGFGAHEGLTILVAWPKGVVAQSDDAAEWAALLRDNTGLVLSLAGLLLVLVYYGIAWGVVGKDPPPGTIIPLYAPPPGFSPAAVRDLMRMGFDKTAFAANVIDLAVKGVITINYDGSEYTLRCKGVPGANVLPDEKLLFSKLLGDRNSLRLTQSNHETIAGAISALKSSLSLALEKTYFVRNFWWWLAGLLFSLVPLGVSLLDAKESPAALGALLWLSIWTLGVTLLLSQVVQQWRSRHVGQAIFLTLFSLPFVGGEIMGLWFFTQATTLWVPGLFLVGATLNGIFYHLLKAPTKAGRRVLDQIDGFKLYLTVAEKDRLNLQNPPQRTPELFEMFLPYALALGVEQKWSEQFADVLAAVGQAGREYHPGWYSGTSLGAFGTGAFAGALGSSFSSAIASSSTAPGSSSGGGGGGSSGGGGGGGGGGGW